MAAGLAVPGGGSAAAGLRASTTSTSVASGAVSEGIYVIRSAEGIYVGQSRNIDQRFLAHAQRFTQAELAAAERIFVPGGKTAREAAEQLKIDSFGGKNADGVLNIVNPVGDVRSPSVMAPPTCVPGRSDEL